MLEKLLFGVVNGTMIAGFSVMAAQHEEYKSMIVDTATRIEAPNQLTRDIKHPLMTGHEIVSGKVITTGEPMQGSHQGTKSEFIPYTIKSDSGKIYNVASREHKIFNLGDDATVLLGWNIINCRLDNCESLPYRIIEAFQ